ncbi:hypothetical protein [Sandaracinus amylolyticus]|uniref:TolB protein n=1 Tax=Sandaracinus amylolyticus TaxID=927083 RepID=A0A0F6W789_9BACT|nr:hypothetical protein [Sandaracinus amylolyticus]AKF09096.1 tolB protein precursor [Sandaracinus amylolyticus]
MRDVALASGIAAIALCACTVEAPGDDADASIAPFDAGADAGRGYLVFFDEGLDEAIERRFESAMPASSEPPRIVYPENGTLVPPNLVGVDVHFTGRTYDTFELTFSQRGARAIVVYAWCRPVGSGCVLQPWDEVWSALASRRNMGPFEMRMRGLAGERVSAPSERVELELAQEAIQGALYFWSTDPPSIRRYDFALGRRSSELYLSQTEEGTCVGCHAISRDGSRIAVGVYDATNGFRARIYDVATRSQVLASEIDAPLPAYGAADDLLVSGSPPPADGMDRPLRIVSGADGRVLHEFGVSGVSADWSPDGSRVVFEGAIDAETRALQLIARSGEAWGAPTVIETAGTEEEHGPAFAPDSEWIGYTGRVDARSVLVATRGSDVPPVVLQRALGASTDATWIRWNPSPYLQQGRRIYWLTFSSGRAHGVVDGGERQIWIAAFDPEADADDPSRPALRFPGQRGDVDNFIAEWTTEARRQPCEDDDDCPAGEVCVDGFCFPEGPE